MELNHILYRFLITGAFVLYATKNSGETPVKGTEKLGYLACQHLCKRIFGCTAHEYVTSDLSCHVTYDKGLNKLSERGKQRIQICQGSPKRKQPRKMTKLLMLQYQRNGGSQPGKFLYLQNNSIVNYPAVHSTKVLAVDYIAAFRRVVIVSSKKPELRIVSLVDKSFIFEKRGSFIGVSVDQRRELIFVTSYKPNQIRMMKAGSTKLRTAFSVSFMPADIAADHKRSMLYIVWANYKLLKFTYVGKMKGEITHGMMRTSLCLDAQKNILYFMMKQPASIFRMSVSDNRITKVADLEYDAWDLYTSGSTIYVTPTPFKGFLIVIYDNGKTDHIYVGFERGTNSVSLCGMA